MLKLGVNVDHIATLREARGGIEPDPIQAALVCEKAGSDSIVAHLREDRRHINDKDIKLLKKKIKTHLNLEMSINKDIVDIAKKIVPYQATLVPEKRQELTTEGGMNVFKNPKRIAKVVKSLKKKGIRASIFIDPKKRDIIQAKKMGASIIEIHSGQYSLAKTKTSIDKEFKKIKEAVNYALSLNLTVNLGHGLDYSNVRKISKIKGVNELNIGHSIISRATFTGIFKAVKDMKALMK